MNVLFSHRHTRFALCYHSLAMINCLRVCSMSDDRRSRYERQIELNQSYIRKCVKHGTMLSIYWRSLLQMAFTQSSEHQHLDRSSCALPYVSYNISLISHKDAELASLRGNSDAFKLYDVAVKYVLYLTSYIETYVTSGLPATMIGCLKKGGLYIWLAYLLDQVYNGAYSGLARVPFCSGRRRRTRRRTPETRNFSSIAMGC